MNWLSFGIGLMLGGMLGVFVMCLCFVSGEASLREEQLEQQLTEGFSEGDLDALQGYLTRMLNNITNTD